ncbi:hypothetical protein K435DRAFT_960212 [Dendrothele bispora CBS 962.96]|uniref:Uncharacterized protein n=1 Tax=Dendrothele bispora (strain CBS 962.96) TaxID=1314807 RepID=A0A4S8MV55_DENBC|nr:hypothetical protein K435DRAFT_960212 [Dendrothele bispora CBS 962.96]
MTVVTELKAQGLLTPYDNDWEDFRKAYWGKPEKEDELRATRLLVLPTFIPEVLLIPVGTVGRNGETSFVYVRDEYIFLYDRLCEAYQKKTPGFVVTGDRGIGKSLFNLYGMARQFMEEKTVVYCPSGSLAAMPLIFDASGTYKLNRNYEREYLLYKPPIWCFHDTPDVWENSEKSPPNDKLGCCFLIFVSPDKKQCEPLLYGSTLPFGLLYMNPWNDADELNHFLEVQGFPEEPAYYEVVGPSIRDYLRCVEEKSSEWFKKKVQEYFTVIGGQERLAQMSRPAPILLAVTRDEDNYRGSKAKFKSPWIENLFMQEMPLFPLTLAEEIFDDFSRAGGDASTGPLFERIAGHYLTGEEWTFRHFGDFCSLKESVPGSRKFDTFAMPTVLLKITERRPYHYENVIDHLDIDHTLLAIPQNSDNALFYAVAFEVSKSKGIVVWIFQTTVISEHAGSNQGYTALQQIKEKVEKKNSKFQFRYVLVVPGAWLGEKRKVSWTLPPDQDGGHEWVRGEVYVQFIHV